MIRTRHFPIFAFLAAAASSVAAGEEMFPFVIPGLAAPAAGSVVDLSGLNDRPAGRLGPVRVKDGHFVDGGGARVRFLGTNFTFGSCFPDHETADKLAARLASLGINAIRFHHMDNRSAPDGLWKAGTPKRNELDPGQLDRLDYFIAALKRAGIYADVNLHVSRNYWEGEDFPDGLASDAERRERLPNYGKGLDRINDHMIRMQRDYAGALLTHVNAYTGKSYAKDPCVAIVEINNENTLLSLKVDELPEFYRAEIARKWNAWLKQKYRTTTELAAAWGGREAMGPNFLPAKPTMQGAQYLALADAPEGALRVTVRQTPEVSWHAQLHWTGLTLEADRVHTLSFRARSDAPRRLPVSTRLSETDWHNCGLSETAEVGPEWKTYSYSFRATKEKAGAVRFDIVVGGGPLGDFELREVSLCRGGSLGLKPGESLEADKVEPTPGAPGSARALDWARFLTETERAYTEGMRRFLKDELGVTANIIDTQASYGGVAGAYRESGNDFIDMHAYWQHPHFPGKPWDSGNWTIANTPMVADKTGGTLARLGTHRVEGMAFTVTEYDHPAPSHYAAELFPMLAGFASAQDWDGLFQFDWGGKEAEARRITGYFSLQQHPGKLAFLPAAALIFRRGDVARLPGLARLDIPKEKVAELASTSSSLPEVWKKAGLTNDQILSHRLELRFVAEGDIRLDRIDKDTRPSVSWDAEAGLYTVDAPSAKAVVGRCAGKTTKLDEAEFAVEPNERMFAVLALNAADGRPLP